MSREGMKEHLDRTFFALSDSTRRDMLARLAQGEATVSELASPHSMSLPAVLKHLGVLRDAGLITEEKDGRVRRCRLDGEALMKANSWISHYRKFWEAQLDDLDSYLKTLDEPPNDKNKNKKKTTQSRKNRPTR